MRTLSDIQVELARVYRAARTRKLELDEAKALGYLLQILSNITKDATLEARVAALEERMSVAHRIKQIERALASRTPAAAVALVDPVEQGRMLERLRANFNALHYLTWRHDGLPLEQLLALARDDERNARENLKSSESDRDEGPLRFAGLAVREFEIRILEREAHIDAASALALRENARAHFMHSVLAGTVVPGNSSDTRVDLLPLPLPIDFDESVALAEARTKCPRRSSLPLERQLEMEHEDHAHEVQLRSKRHPGSGRVNLNASLDVVHDRMHQLRVESIEGLMAGR